MTDLFVLLPDELGDLVVVHAADLLNSLAEGRDYHDAISDNAIDTLPSPLTPADAERLTNLNRTGDAAAYWNLTR